MFTLNQTTWAAIVRLRPSFPEDDVRRPKKNTEMHAHKQRGSRGGHIIDLISEAALWWKAPKYDERLQLTHHFHYQIMEKIFCRFRLLGLKVLLFLVSKVIIFKCLVLSVHYHRSQRKAKSIYLWNLNRSCCLYKIT